MGWLVNCFGVFCSDFFAIFDYLGDNSRDSLILVSCGHIFFLHV